MPAPDAVVHLAAIPSPVHATPDRTFRTNVVSTHACSSPRPRARASQRVVWASSETTLGLPFDQPPDYVPVDEAARAPSRVGLRAVEGARRGDGAAVQPLERHPVRRAAVLERDGAATTTQRFPGYWDDPHARKWNLWSYVDERDVAQASGSRSKPTCRAETFIIAAADTVMKRPSRELMAEVFPDVPIRGELAEHGSLLAIDKADSLLGYTPQVSWRTVLQQ